jgi:hypothetical protein
VIRAPVRTLSIIVEYTHLSSVLIDVGEFTRTISMPVRTRNISIGSLERDSSILHSILHVALASVILGTGGYTSTGNSTIVVL